MKLFTFFLFFILSIFTIQAQTEDAWIYFTDKPNASYFYAHPLEMLSQRALNRRQTQNIALDIKDVPLYSDYVSQIQNSEGITLIASSKWLNCLHIQGTQAAIASLGNLSFVASIEYANHSLNNKLYSVIHSKKQVNKFSTFTDFNYGNASNQIVMLHGNFLHQNNYTGSGIQIAVIDAGFTNVNTMSSFDRLRNNNQILGTYNFIERDNDVYFRHYHGTMVLSTMAGYVENQFVGTAPDASYYLFITEDGNQEHPYEESLWVEAAEKADSLGVDVINTSLAYSLFDRTEYDHTYDDMNGQTTFISRGAAIGFSRGMLLVNSAGNDGNSPWHYIAAPADTFNVLTIGAVDASGNIASFSSWGPNASGLIKPDVCAQGAGSAIINTSNTIINGNGTSFSSPILAGAASCLWQAFPNKTNAQISQIIKESAHLYATPDFHYGYGIPNFEWAYNTLKLEETQSINLTIFPNPIASNEQLNILLSQIQPNTLLTISEINGKVILKQKLDSVQNQIDIRNFSQGLYFISIQSEQSQITQKLMIY